MRLLTCSGVALGADVVDAMVGGEPYAPTVEEGFAALGDLERFDASCDNFLPLVIVAIYGISNLDVDDSYFTTVGVDKGVWR